MQIFSIWDRIVAVCNAYNQIFSIFKSSNVHFCNISLSLPLTLSLFLTLLFSVYLFKFFLFVAAVYFHVSFSFRFSHGGWMRRLHNILFTIRHRFIWRVPHSGWLNVNCGSVFLLLSFLCFILSFGWFVIQHEISQKKIKMPIPKKSRELNKMFMH